ncbi:MAG TPA: hypothetical protein VGC26_11835, partial [Afipia sp.]
NLASGVTPGTAFKDKQFSFQRDPAHFNDLGRYYRLLSIKAEWSLLIWAFGGAVLAQIVFNYFK